MNPTLQYQEDQDSVVTSSVEDPDPHDWIHIIFRSWRRIRIKVESWIRIRIKVKIRIRIRICVKVKRRKP
jgi:hypothetical protein